MREIEAKSPLFKLTSLKIVQVCLDELLLLLQLLVLLFLNSNEDIACMTEASYFT